MGKRIGNTHALQIKKYEKKKLLSTVISDWTHAEERSVVNKNVILSHKFDVHLNVNMYIFYFYLEVNVDIFS